MSEWHYSTFYLTKAEGKLDEKLNCVNWARLMFGRIHPKIMHDRCMKAVSTNSTFQYIFKFSLSVDTHFLEPAEIKFWENLTEINKKSNKLLLIFLAYGFHYLKHWFLTKRNRKKFYVRKVGTAHEIVC